MATNKQFAQESFTGLPGWAKGVIAVAVIGGIGYLVWKLVKLPGNIKEDQSNRQEEKNWNKELDELNSNPKTKATLTKAQMLSIANKMYAAMDGYGTDELAIIAGFKQIKNDADYAGVQAAYGIKDVKPGTGTGWFVDPYHGGLTGALTDELSQYWKDLINTSLSKKGITYQV
jgi:hypothetical protein